MKTHGLLLPWEVDTDKGAEMPRIVTQAKANGCSDIVCVFPVMLSTGKKQRYAEAIVAGVNTYGTARRLGDRLWREMSQISTRTFSRELWNLADKLRNLTQ